LYRALWTWGSIARYGTFAWRSFANLVRSKTTIGQYVDEMAVLTVETQNAEFTEIEMPKASTGESGTDIHFLGRLGGLG